MCTPLAKLAIGLSATMATGFFYLAAAPPAGAAIDVCGPGNFSSACAPDNSPSPKPPSNSSIKSLRSGTPAPTAPEPEPEPELPTVAPPATPDPVPQLPVVESVAPLPTVAPPAIPDPVPQLPAAEPPAVITNPLAPVPTPIPTPSLNFTNIYTNNTPQRATSIPEPGTVIALLVTGAGIICSGRKRNKQVGQSR